ncbi:hypothetical protein HMPREF1544_05354 [Mucor circinelloides 1006PhL]|uniref:Arrestin C-terminal-like domain-containing protein n=1 Tax=Mucor circinelloides f. circinelloides (strain 1006PhL) TaxID=1220926 RepID=S2K6J2_MUCC1|nr:hypothetical protein HMPREF1544_05354 [Mucor circinelloides 1006PhL]
MISAFGKSIDLKINVQSDEIVLLGHANEAAGKMLQGSLILNISEPIKVKSVNLSFVGKMKVSWSEGVGHHQHFHKQERTILSHAWEFVKPQLISRTSNSSQNATPHKKSTVLSAGQHKWDFELLLPGNLAQTLDSDVGSVSYRLKATIERSAFVQNTVKKRNIRIVRCILPSQFELVQSLEIHNTWAQKMVYDISVPSKLYAFNDTIPISFKILPIASHLRVHAIMASIKEYCTYTANSHTKTDTRIVRLVRVDHPFSEAVSTTTSPPTWDRVLDLPVPSKSPVIFADADSDMIRIRHRLKFVISLANADGHISELRCAVQIIVVESFAVTEELTTLPAYDESWRSVPYDPHVVEQLRTRTSISEAGTNEPILSAGVVGLSSTRELQDSRQPVNITGWSRMLSLSSAVAVPDRISEELEERSSSELTTHSRPVTIPGSNSGSRHHSRRPSMDFEESSAGDLDLLDENASSPSRPLWWNGVDLGKVPSYRSVSTLNQDLFSASLPPAYDSLAAAFANASPRRH